MSSLLLFASAGGVGSVRSMVMGRAVIVGCGSCWNVGDVCGDDNEEVDDDREDCL